MLNKESLHGYVDREEFMEKHLRPLLAHIGESGLVVEIHDDNTDPEILEGLQYRALFVQSNIQVSFYSEHNSYVPEGNHVRWCVEELIFFPGTHDNPPETSDKELYTCLCLLSCLSHAVYEAVTRQLNDSLDQYQEELEYKMELENQECPDEPF